MRSVLDATGYVVARRMATVSAKITGKVRDVRIEEGQRVEAGQIMATLDPIDADAQRDLAASQVAAARSQIGSVQAQLREAEANAGAPRRLVQQQLVSKAQYDQASPNAMRCARNSPPRSATRRSPPRPAHRRPGRRQHHRARAVRRRGHRQGRAAGRNRLAAVAPAAASPAPASARIVDMDSLEVEVEVSEAFIGRVQPKMPVEAMLNAYPDWKIPAEVIAIIPAADRGKATVKVRVALKRSDPRIVPDMGVRVCFLERRRRSRASSAAAAPRARARPLRVREGGDRTRLRRRRRRIAARARVRLGGTLATTARSLAGLGAGDTVVLAAAGHARRMAPRSSRRASRIARRTFAASRVHATHEQSPIALPEPPMRSSDPQPHQDLRARPGERRRAAWHRPGHASAAISSR